MRVAVLGLGAVGSRAARQLASAPGVDRLLVGDVDRGLATRVQASLGEVAEVVDPATADLAGCDVALLAGPGAVHRGQAERALDVGASVVSSADELSCARQLLALGEEAAVRGRTVLVGAAFAPGLSDLLARHAGALFDEVHEVHVARHGTGGPSCARAHHGALRGQAIDWRDGAWARRQGGSGRELAWFPDPVAGQDCYRAAMPDALLLQPAFPLLRRATARASATRRDRLTSPFPMLRSPHPEGLVGAIRVEVRGLRGRSFDTVVYGAVDRPGLAAGAVAAVGAVAIGRGDARPGAHGMATAFDDPVPLLRDLAERGVRCAAFTGVAT